MAKKKKKGKGKRKAKQVPSLSNLERQTLQITIENLKNKIQWRKLLNDIVKEEIIIYEEVNELELRDKQDAVRCLEQAIQDQDLVFEKIKTEIPDENKMLAETEETLSFDLATKLKSINEEKTSYDAKLQEIRVTLANLESYDISEVEMKISEIDKSLKSLENSKSFKEKFFEESLQKFIRCEMQDMFLKKIDEYQEKIASKVDGNLLRITEETRWWENSGQILLNMKENVEESNRARLKDVQKLKSDLKQRREKTSENSSRTQELERKIVAIEGRVEELQKVKENKSRLAKKSNFLNILKKENEKNTKTQHLELMDCTSKMVDNENIIRGLETELSKAEEFGYLLSDVITKALDLIAEEVKYPLIKTHEDPLEKSDVLIELDSLFTKAIHMIHNSTHQ